MRQIVISSLLLLTAFAGDLFAQNSPGETASRFYTLVIKNDFVGLPDEKGIKLLNPYLSKSLQDLFAKAIEEQEKFSREYPREKPPLADGCLFSCAFEGPARYTIGKHRISGRFAYVPIIQSDSEKTELRWTDTLVLVKEGGAWRVWDVRMGCKSPFRMGPTLRAMLTEK
jgi:hypothetical protein